MVELIRFASVAAFAFPLSRNRQTRAKSEGSVSGVSGDRTWRSGSGPAALGGEFATNVMVAAGFVF